MQYLTKNNPNHRKNVLGFLSFSEVLSSTSGIRF
ncbi:hypothetical protein [Fervidobacterium pennivorans]